MLVVAHGAQRQADALGDFAELPSSIPMTALVAVTIFLAYATFGWHGIGALSGPMDVAH